MRNGRSRVLTCSHSNVSFCFGRTATDRRPACLGSDLSLFGHLKCIVDLNAEISDCAFKFGMAK